MKLKTVFRTCSYAFAGVFVFTACLTAQEKQQSLPAGVKAYDVARESVLQGTVISYTASSTVPPLGAHVKVQTASGVVDVHIGNGRLLTANHVELQSGDTIKITGENVPYNDSTVFAARLIQKGSQTVTLRSMHGTPLMATPHTTVPAEGVR